MIPLSSPNTEGLPLLSLPRFGLTVFPLFLALAVLGERPRVHAAIVGVSAICSASRPSSGRSGSGWADASSTAVQAGGAKRLLLHGLDPVEALAAQRSSILGCR